jgi:hypothetical protein
MNGKIWKLDLIYDYDGVFADIFSENEKDNIC